MLSAALSCSHCKYQNCIQLIPVAWDDLVGFVGTWCRGQNLSAAGKLQKQVKLSIGYEQVLIFHL